jgi:manganese transport protein
MAMQTMAHLKEDAAPGRWLGQRLITLAGPGSVVAVGYMDPGNWATDIAAGARHGFALLSAVLVASLAGIFLQALAVRLTAATGRDLASLIRAEFPKPVWLVAWAGAEVALVATDVAELLGSAIALQLLFGLPIALGVAIAALLTFALLMLPGAGGRAPEIAVAVLAGIVALGFAWELALARPAVAEMLRGFVPTGRIFSDPEMLYLSLGILGATVMPHNLFLHSGLAASRLAGARDDERRRRGDWLTLDSTIALAGAFIVNAAILAVAAVAFHGTSTIAGEPGIADASRLIGASLGGVAAMIFAVTLLAAGQSATASATMAGQIVTDGFLRLRVAPWLRLLLTRSAALLPALGVPLLYDASIDRLLVLSQVVLGLALPFVLVPMLVLMRNRRLMGGFALSPAMLRLAMALIVSLAGLGTWLAGASVV